MNTARLVSFARSQNITTISTQPPELANNNTGPVPCGQSSVIPPNPVRTTGAGSGEMQQAGGAAIDRQLQPVDHQTHAPYAFPLQIDQRTDYLLGTPEQAEFIVQMAQEFVYRNLTFAPYRANHNTFVLQHHEYTRLVQYVDSVLNPIGINRQ